MLSARDPNIREDSATYQKTPNGRNRMMTTPQYASPRDLKSKMVKDKQSNDNLASLTEDAKSQKSSVQRVAS